MKGILIILVESIFLLFTVSCVTTGDYTSLRNDVNQLFVIQGQQSKEIEMLKKEIYELKKTERRSGGINKNIIKAVRDSQEVLYNQLKTLRKELQILQARMEENNYKINRSIQQSNKERMMLKAQISSIKDELNEVKTKIALKEGPSSGVSPTTHVNPKEVYQEALQMLKVGNTKEARSRFQDFIKNYPDSELTDNAQFWIAESYYRENNYEEAILSYETLIKEYPDSNKIPDAMLKQALSFLKLGDKNTTKVILSTLIEKFPNSNAAKIAKEKLKEI